MGQANRDESAEQLNGSCSNKSLGPPRTRIFAGTLSRDFYASIAGQSRPASPGRVNDLTTLRTVDPDARFTAGRLIVNKHMRSTKATLTVRARADDSVRVTHEPVDAALSETNCSYDTKSLSAKRQTDTEGIPKRCYSGEGMERVRTDLSTCTDESAGEIATHQSVYTGQ